MIAGQAQEMNIQSLPNSDKAHERGMMATTATLTADRIPTVGPNGVLLLPERPRPLRTGDAQAPHPAGRRPGRAPRRSGPCWSCSPTPPGSGPSGSRWCSPAAGCSTWRRRCCSWSSLAVLVRRRGAVVGHQRAVGHPAGLGGRGGTRRRDGRRAAPVRRPRHHLAVGDPCRVRPRGPRRSARQCSGIERTYRRKLAQVPELNAYLAEARLPRPQRRRARPDGLRRRAAALGLRHGAAAARPVHRVRLG